MGREIAMPLEVSALMFLAVTLAAITHLRLQQRHQACQSLGLL